MILEAETALLEAVRVHLMEALGLKHDQIDCEIDDLAPSVAGAHYVSLSPANGAPGRHNNAADQSFHYMFGVRACVVQRVGEIPRDQRRSVFMTQLRSINKQLSRISRFIRFNYDTINRANEILSQESTNGL